MARRVTPEDIKHINDVYYLCKNYSKTAQATGWSAGTVKKYIIDGYEPEAHKVEYSFNPKSVDEVASNLVEDSDITLLSEKEKREVEKLWETLVV